MNKPLNLDRLRYFVAVAEELHFGRAAERLGISQPPLSLQIQKLEAEIGAPLLDRSTRRVELTEAGNALLQRARAILTLSELAVDEARRAASGTRGLLKLGFVGSASYRLLPVLLQTFRAESPEVELHLTEMPTAEQTVALESGRIDAGLARSPVIAGRIENRVVWREPFVVALPSSHHLANTSSVAIEALKEERFVSFPRSLGPGLYQRFLALCAAAGFTPDIRQEAIQMQTIAGLVGAGFGVAIVPDCVRDFRLRGVVYRPLTGSDATTDLELIWNPERASPTLLRFIEIATQGTVYAKSSITNS